MSFAETIEALAAEHVRRIMADRERICEAFIAETGLLPSECEQVTEYTAEGQRWYVRKRTTESVLP